VSRPILAFALCYLARSMAIAAEAGGAITTDDGLSLALGTNGEVAAIRLDQREVPLSARPALM